MVYTKEVKPTATHTAGAMPTDSWLSHLYGCLLCEDGSYLLNEDSSRIALEWYHNLVVKPTPSASSSSVKPVTVWST